MFTKEKEYGVSTKNIPIYNIRMMTDDEWNRLAYKNYLERQEKERVTEKKVY